MRARVAQKVENVFESIVQVQGIMRGCLSLKLAFLQTLVDCGHTANTDEGSARPPPVREHTPGSG